MKANKSENNTTEEQNHQHLKCAAEQCFKHIALWKRE